MVNGSEHSEQALALIRFLLAEEAQTYFSEETFEYPIASGVSPVAGLPALSSLETPAVNLNDLDTLQATIQMIKDAGLA